MLNGIDKTYATEKLEITKEKLFSELNGLSQAQLAFKPNAETWNINEILEHTALAENGIWQAVRQGFVLFPIFLNACGTPAGMFTT